MLKLLFKLFLIVIIIIIKLIKMGQCVCIRSNNVIYEMSSLAGEMLKETDYKTLQNILTKNFTIYEKDLSLFKEVKEEIINTKTSYSSTFDAILDCFLVPKNPSKIRTYDLLVFFFPLAKHKNIAKDFYDLATHYDIKDKKNTILYRDCLINVLKKILTFHSIMLFKRVPFDFKSSYRDEFENYERMFTESHISQYVDIIVSKFDKKLKQKELYTIINDKIFYFSLESLEDCFHDYGQILSDAKYLLYDFEKVFQSNLNIEPI